MSRSDIMKEALNLETEDIIHHLKIYRVRLQENPKDDNLPVILDALRIAYKEKTGKKSEL